MCKILGVGMDLCAIDRMAQQLNHRSFLDRCLTAQEQAYIAGRGQMAAASLAGLWAAKEAALKALGVGISIPMTDVEITHTKAGQPIYLLHGRAEALAQGGSMHLSITHEGDMAAAFCVWQSAE